MNDIDPRILRFFDQELSEKEVRDFLSELESNDALSNEFQLYSLIIEGIKSEGAEELKEYIKTRVEAETTETKTNIWLYAAASAAILIIGYFAIFKYLETGSLKATKDYITLNDEKANKFKFWNKRKEPAKIQKITKPYSTYEDSLRMLGEEGELYAVEESINENNGSNYIADDIEGNVPNEQPAENESPEAEKSSQSNKEILLAQQSVIPIQLSGLGNSVLSPAPSAGIEYKTKMKSAAPSIKKMEAASDTISNKPTESASRTLPLKSFRYLVSIFETYSREEALIIRKDGNLMHVMVYNMAANNPLLYIINDELYLELGLDKIYKIPSIPQKIINPKPISDKKIIKLIKN
jgi:hypothetical protein